jgi:hypothetical protein
MEIISDENEMMAIVIRANQGMADVNFPTPSSLSMQMGALRRPQGYKVAIHYHEKPTIKGPPIQEILFVKKGIIKLILKNFRGSFTKEVILKPLDVIMLISCWHGLEVLENCELIEIKPGTYPDQKIYHEQSDNNPSNI